MFKLKIIGLYSLAIALIVILAIIFISQRERGIVRKIKQTLKNSNEIYSKIRQLREKKQEILAWKISESRLKAYLLTLENFRSRLENIQKSAYVEHPGTSEEDIKARSAIIENLDPSFLDEFINFLADEIGVQSPLKAGEKISREKFLKIEKENLRRCSAIGVDQCFFEYSYNPLMHILAEIAKESEEKLSDIIIISDEKGIGLANSINPKWSNKVDFADRFPLIFAAKEKNIRDIIFFDETQKFYFITSRAIYSNSRYLGNIIVGDEIGEALLGKEKFTTGTEITYLKGNKLIHSSLSPTHYEKFFKEQDFYETPEYISIAFSVKDYYSEGNLRVVLSVNKRHELEILGNLKNSIFLLGFLVLIIGLAAIQILLRDFYRPFEVIDAGIHEVISGNFDHQFEFNFKEELPKTIGEALNLMKLVLLGKPFPEEEEEKSEEWAKSLLIEEEVSARAKGESGLEEISTTEISSIEKIAPSSQILKETADVYYRRIYKEYIEAKQSLGEKVEDISYLKFVEKIVRSEVKLKKKFKCRAVRFAVTIREGNVILSPIPIYEKIEEEEEEGGF